MAEGTTAIIGAGIAGVAAAWALSARGVKDIVIIDDRPPLTLTSDKSTECYRNWWPGPGDAMVALMNASIDAMERLADASGNVFGLNRRGYLYVTRELAGVARLRDAATEAAALGAGPLRQDDAAYAPSPPHGFAGQPDGADLLTDRDAICRHFPFLAPDVVAVLHARRCGWLSAQQLGQHLLAEATACGVILLAGQVTRGERDAGSGWTLTLSSAKPQQLAASRVINCAGPMARSVGLLLGQDLPLRSERHQKLAWEDRLGAIPRDAPMLICADALILPWDADERALLADDPHTAHLTGALPAGAHLRPEGHGASAWVLGLWPTHTPAVAEIFPVPLDDGEAEVTMRGLVQIVPGLQPYVDRPPRPILDGGYYTKTRENRPLVGPAGVPGAYTISGLSGYGIMAACGAAELLAAHITGAPLPRYAPAFLPSRYNDPDYQALLTAWGDEGQL